MWLIIEPKGTRANLIGYENLPEAVEYELRSRFCWYSPLDLNEQIYFYYDGVLTRGIAQDVCAFLNEAGYECTIAPITHVRQFDWHFRWEYRPLQEPAVTAALASYSGILKAGPGSGKTAMAAAIIAHAGVKTAIIVPNERPFTQMLTHLREATDIESIGAFGDGDKTIGDVTVIMVQSAISELRDNPKGELAKFLYEVGAVVVDEGHRAGSVSHKMVLDKIGPNCNYVLALTATPERPDDKSQWVDSYFGRIFHEITYRDAIDAGILCPVTVYYATIRAKSYGYIEQRTTTTFMRGKQYQKVYDDYVVNNQERNELAVEFARSLNNKGLSCAIIVARIEHGKTLHALMPEAVVLTASTKNRQDIFDKLQRKEILTVITTLMDEAADVPSLSAVALMAGGKSPVKLIQRIRSLRTFDGETAQGHFTKNRGYVLYPIDRADFLTSHSHACRRLLDDVVSEHETNEVINV